MRAQNVVWKDEVASLVISDGGGCDKPEKEWWREYIRGSILILLNLIYIYRHPNGDCSRQFSKQISSVGESSGVKI